MANTGGGTVGPLEGVRIVEIVGIGPGPFAGMLFADMGAEVIGIERPGSSPSALPYDVNRRGKRFIELDLKSPEGRDELLRLLESADALIEGSRPGVMERLGLSPEVCWERNSKLVYGRMTGWGQDGPLARAAGHDLNYIALSGALYSMGVEGKPPPVPLNVVGDYGGGAMFLAFGVVCALHEAARSGRGQVVDASMVEGTSLLMSLMHSLRASKLWNEQRGSNFLDGGAHFYGVFKTSDECYVSLGAIEPHFAAEFAKRVGLDAEFLSDHMNPKAWPTLRIKLEELFSTKTRDEWCELLEGTDSCFAPVVPFWEAHVHPHNRARGSFIELDGVVQPGPAPRFSRTKPMVDGARVLDLLTHERSEPAGFPPSRK
ncbi:MAG: CaiB/BaiF CoA-transferase family protein [Myxococcota bacterium]